MINKVKRIKIRKDLYGKYHLTVFQFSPLLNEKYEFLIGSFYGIPQYPQVALYESTKNGDILNNIPVINEEGFLTFEDLFDYYNYILIEN